MTRIAFLSAGAPRHGANLTKEIQSISDKNAWGWECRFIEWKENRGYEDEDWTGTDWIWNVGNFENIFQWLAQGDKPKAICHWVGTDILQHFQLAQRGYRDPFNAATIHIADAPNLQREAAELTGLDVGYVRFIPPESYEPQPLESWTDVLLYVPKGREDFFRWSLLLEIAKDYPQLTFHVLARDDNGGVENVRVVPEVGGSDKRELFTKCSAFLRPIEHDGVSLTTIEMAQLGRWNLHSGRHVFGALPAGSVGEMEFQLDTILADRSAPDPTISEFYRKEYSYARLEDDVGRLRGRIDAL